MSKEIAQRALLESMRHVNAHKEWITAQANRDMVMFEEWRVDYDAMHGQQDAAYEKLLTKLEKLHDQPN